MTYKYITQFTSPNQNIRRMKIQSIVIHHWGSKGQKFDNVVNWLCQRRAGTSAHYVVEAGKVACIVDPDKRAWHAGSSKGNHVSIGIECRPEATDGDYETVAELIANLRKTYGDLPLQRHKDWTKTECPGDWDIERLDKLARGSAPSKPKAPAKTPTFPLPSGFYYGDASGPKQSVSGKTANSSAKSDVVKDSKGNYYSKGLKVWQKRMKDRGSSISVDGRYGPQTEKVAIQFKKAKRGWTDGRIGVETWKLAFEEPVT